MRELTASSLSWLVLLGLFLALLGINVAFVLSRVMAFGSKPGGCVVSATVARAVGR